MKVNGHTFKWQDLPIGSVVNVRMAVLRRGQVMSQWTNERSVGVT